MVLGYFDVLGKKYGFYDSEYDVLFLAIGTIIFYILLILINANILAKRDLVHQEKDSTIRRKQLQLQAILDHANALIYICDAEGRCLLVNKLFEKIFHISSTELIGKDSQSVLPSPYAEDFARINNKVIQTRTAVMVVMIITEDGPVFYLSNKFPLFDERGIPYAVAGISADITPIKRIQESLRESEERLTLALKSAQAGTWSWDISKDIIVWDDYMHKLFGLNPATFPGQFEFVINLIHPDDRQRYVEE